MMKRSDRNDTFMKENFEPGVTQSLQRIIIKESVHM